MVSFTVTPILASRFAKLESSYSDSLLNRFGRMFERMFGYLTTKYVSLLGWSLHHPYKVLYLVVAGFIIILMIPVSGLTGFEFMKQTDRSQFSMALEFTPGTTLDYNNRQTQKIERRIASLPEVTSILTNVGKGGDGVATDNQTEIVVSLCPKEQRSLTTAQLGQKVKELTADIPGVKVYINQIGFTGGTSSAPVNVEITGVNHDSIMKSAGLVASNLIMTPGVTYLKLSATQGNPETRVEIDRQKMAALGLTVTDVGTALQVALTGNNDSKYREGSNQYDIRVALDKFDRTNPDNIAHLSFVNFKREIIELQQFATIYQSSGPTKLERKNRNAMTTVSAYTDGSPSGSIIQAFAKKMGTLKAQGTRINFGGDQDEMVTSFLGLFVALIAGILFVYFIMVILYDSFLYPFVVLFSIPVALIGAILALALTGNTINVFSILGIIMMVGLVAKNAILIVDRANDRRKAGETIFDALIDAGKMRIRPIFMTTFAMIFGMLPIATASGAGAEWKNGLAWVLIGGLTSSMFLTLIVVPIMYDKMATLLEKKKKRLPEQRKKPNPAPPSSKILLVIILIISMAGIFSVNAHSPVKFKTGYVTVAVVYDGPAKINQEFQSYLVQEVKGLMAGQVDVDFLDPMLTTGSWTMERVKAIDTRLLADTSIDIIIGMGVLASQDLASRKGLMKPVIAGLIINWELQRLPNFNGASGVPNLCYIQFKPSLENEFKELKKIVPFKNLAFVISKDFFEVLNPEHRTTANFDTIGNVKINLILADTSADEILNAIPRDADAVYLDAMFRLPISEFTRLMDSLTTRKLPSFGFDQTLVEEGALASVYPRIILRLSKRIALNIQQILLGQNASSLPIELLLGRGVFLNLGTFAKLGLKLISWDLFTEATIVDLRKRDNSARFISLPDVMTLALDSNQDLVAKKFEVMAGSKDINIARSVLLPYLDVNATGMLNDKQNYQPPQMITANANASQILYSEPSWANLKIEKSRQTAREEDLNSRKLDIGNQVAHAYLNILESRNNFYLMINNLMISRSNLEVSQMKKEAGSAGEDEVLRWQVEVAKSKSNVITAFSSISQVSYQLIQLVHVKNLTAYDLDEFNLERSGLLVADSGFFEILDDPIRLQTLSNFLVKEGIQNSPVIRQYQFLIEAQERYYKSSNISRFIPTTTAFGNYSNRLYQTPVEIQNGIPVSYATYSWSVGAKVEIPLFTGLKNNAVMQQSRLSLAQLKSEQLSSIDKLESTIRSNLSTLMSTYYDYKQMKIAESSANKNLEINNNQYLLGKKSILDVLDAQQQNLSSSLSVNTSFYNFLKNYFNLQQSLGRFDYKMSDQEKSDFKKRLVEFMQR